jgi:amino acid transporter
VVLSGLLPLTIVGILGTGFIVGDLTYIAYLTEALDRTVGDFLGGIMVLGVCAGLLLSMNTATMDGSRALYGMARDGLTIKQLDHLNSHHVPNRAMTLDLVLNIVLLFAFPTIFFVLVAGNIGYVLSHVFALSGFLLLRRDRPNWPRPLKHGPIWIPIAVACLIINLLATIAGVIWIKWTGYLFDPSGDPSGYALRALIVGVAALVLGVVGYIIGQQQAGRGFRWRDLDEDEPSPEVYELMREQGAAAPAR